MSGIAITFPSSPSEGQSYLAQNGFTYIYDSQKNRWKRGGEFVRAPKVLSYAGIAVTTSGSGITTGPTGRLIYEVPGFLIPNSTVGVDTFKAYRAPESYPDYTEVQVSISSDFSSVAYAATFAGLTHTIPPTTLSGDQTYYLRARQFVGSDASAAAIGAISGYSPNVVRFITTSTYLDTPTIVSIAGTSTFPVYQIGFAGTTLPATVTYFGSGVGNLEQVDWRVTGPRNPDSTGDTTLAEIGIGTHSSATLANALVLAMPFSGATGVGITNDVNNAIRTASGASAGTTKTVTANGNAGIATIAGLALTSHFYDGAAYFDGSGDYLTTSASGTDFTVGGAAFTIECWAYFNSFSTTPVIFSAGTGGVSAVVSSSGYLTLYRNGGGGYGSSLSTNQLSTGRWYHLAWVTSNGSQWYGYINGFLAGAFASGWSGEGTTSPGYVSTYGNGVGTQVVNGYLQDLKVYKGLAKYTENFTPPLPTYGTISYTTGVPNVGVTTTAFYQSTGDVGIAETSSTAANALVLAMPMNKTFGFQDINVAVRGLTSGASAGTAKTVGLGTTSTANAPTHPRISATESKWYDGAAYFDGGDYISISSSSDFALPSDFTFECWYYANSWSGSASLSGIFNIGAFNTGMLIRISAVNRYEVFINNTQIISSGAPKLGAWTHLAVVRNSGVVSVYENGILLTSVSNSGSITQNNVIIGASAHSLTETLYGYLQDVKLYKGFAKYTANFTPPRPICGFTTDLAIQTGFTTTSATGVALTSIVGLGSTSTLAFGADQNLAGVTSITSSSGITTLPDPYAQNLVLALPLANITGVGNSFTNDRNTQIRSVSLVGGGVTAGTTKTITNTGVTTVSVASTTQRAYSSFSKFTRASETFVEVTHTMTVPFTIEAYVYLDSLASGNAQCFMNTTPHQVIGISLNRTGNGDTHVYLGNGSAWSCTPCITSSSNITAGKWWHIALVCDGTQTRLYHDGNLVGTTSTIPSGFGSTYRFGRNAAIVGAEAFDGYMQDVRVYNFSKYNTNFTPPPPMFGDYTRSTPNKVVFTPGSDYVLEARNTATGGIVTSVYSATRQWGTKPKGGALYDPYGANLVLAIPGGAVGGATSTFDVTGQIRFETPTASYVNAGIVTYSNSLGIGTYQNKSVTNNGVVGVTTVSKYYGRSLQFNGSSAYLRVPASSDFTYGTDDFTFEGWIYPTTSADQIIYTQTSSGNNFINISLTATTNLLSAQINSSGAGNNVVSITAVTLNTWNHIAVTRESTVVKLFINGVLSGSGTRNVDLSLASIQPTIGTFSHTVSLLFNGYINDFRIYKGLAKYTSNFTPPNQIYLT